MRTIFLHFFLLLSLLLFGCAQSKAPNYKDADKPLFILIHGSWHTGEAWYKVKSLMEKKGAIVYTPTLTGMNRQNPGGPNVGLYTHIQDIVNLIKDKDLHHVILIGHSYSGFVINGVADQLPDRIKEMVYLDAFHPENDQSLFDLIGQKTEKNMRSTLVDVQGRTKADGADKVWLLPYGNAQDFLGKNADTKTVEWLQERVVYTPVKTFEEKLHFKNQAAVKNIPSIHIVCTRFVMGWLGKEAKSRGWKVYYVDAYHDAMLQKPNELVEIFFKIAQE